MLETVQADWEQINDNLGAIGVMGLEGDTKHTWDPKDKTQVEEARKLFALLRSNKYRAFRIKGRNEPGEQLDEFDPKAKRILFLPPFRGG